ncbi:hypothetical protein GGS23DRAFT_598952 [Durotheca rogersii]|uniref:uncharacterized protein n=1 Tax=Durotheca rogersii TaxID=419775 RepID=UPI00222011B3|nr:uncharacterized protein GGS23DRAFT_598952 [Durotheca rogersii]KAI5861075.1 hypothetical protein GGS23DRAFT_598952 [Durotheca rogersii]
MSSKLIPDSPADVAVIRHITPNVVTVSMPFSRFGILRIGGRGTIMRLTSGALAVFSPVALTPETRAKVAEMGGNVGYLIAGDIEHHIYLSEWARAYPGAKLVGPKGLAEKRAAAHGKDAKIGAEPFSFVFGEAPGGDGDGRVVDDEFAADFDVEYVAAHPNREIVLLYKPDRVLVEADLLFNLPAVEQYSRVPAAAAAPREGALRRLANRIFEALNTTAGAARGTKRFLWYFIAGAGGDRDAFNASVRRIASWDFDTIVPCHGETIEGRGKAVFEKMFEWHLQSRK